MNEMDDDDFRDTHTHLDYDELDADRIDSGVCLSTPSLCSEVELTFKNLSLGSVVEEDKYELSKVFSDIPTKALFYQNHDGDTLVNSIELVYVSHLFNGCKIFPSLLKLQMVTEFNFLVSVSYISPLSATTRIMPHI